MTPPPSAEESAVGLQDRMVLSVVIPAYNEAARIGETVSRVVGYLKERWRRWEVLVVDDGSSDGTAQVVQALFPEDRRIRVIPNQENRGKGYAVRSGMVAAEGDLILFSDADLSAPVEELELLLAALKRDYHIAIGSRALRRELILVRQSGLREKAGLAFNLALRTITGLDFQDTQCGFKLFRREAARMIFARQLISGFGFDPEVLYLGKKYGFRTVEVPVRWAHSEGSKVHVLRDGLGMVLDLLRIRFNDLAGRYSEAPPEPVKGTNQ